MKAGWMRRRGRGSKVPHTEKAGRKRRVPPTALELEAVQILRKGSREGKRIVYSFIADE